VLGAGAAHALSSALNIRADLDAARSRLDAIAAQPNLTPDAARLKAAMQKANIGQRPLAAKIGLASHASIGHVIKWGRPLSGKLLAWVKKTEATS